MRFWWYMVGETSTGPISQTQLERLFETGDVTSRSMVWTEGLAQWQEIGSIDEDALPPIRTMPAAEQNTQNSGSSSMPQVRFQGLEGIIDIIEVEPAAVAKKVAPTAVIEPEIVVSEVAPPAEYVEPLISRTQGVHEISTPAPIEELPSDSLLEKTPVSQSKASFLETARQGRVHMPKKKKAQPAPVSSIKPKKSLLPLNLSRLHLMGGVAGLVALLGVSGFMLSTSSASQKAWTNPETFQTVNLAESWKTHKSINAEQQIFYRFSHTKEPIIVQFGKETFLEETSLKDYGELFSMSIKENIYLAPKGIEGKVGQVDSLTFEGYKKRDHTQKVSVSFVKHGNEIWRTLVVNTSGGRAKTKSYQILRRKLMDSLR